MEEGVPWCAACDVCFYENPVPAVAAVAADGEGRLLLVHRDREPQAGKWSLPGGFMEVFESPEEALRRELFEETALVAGDLELLAVADDPSTRYGRIVVICYRVLSWSGQARAGDDARGLGFYSFESLPEIAFPCHRDFLEAYRGRLAMEERL